VICLLGASLLPADKAAEDAASVGCISGKSALGCAALKVAAKLAGSASLLLLIAGVASATPKVDRSPPTAPRIAGPRATRLNDKPLPASTRSTSTRSGLIAASVCGSSGQCSEGGFSSTVDLVADMAISYEDPPFELSGKLAFCREFGTDVRPATCASADGCDKKTPAKPPKSQSPAGG
jgi:hypothetical protein